MKYTRFSVTLVVGTLVVAGCAGDDKAIDGGDSEGRATPIETVAPEPIEATGTGDDGVEPINPADETSIMASYNFSFADDLVLPTNDVGYVYRVDSPVDSDLLGRAADYFGIARDSVVNWDEEAITEDSPTLGLGYTASDPLQPWSYFDGAATASLTECSVDPAEPDATTDSTEEFIVDDETCAAPADPPEGVPDQAGAEAKMADMLKALGVDPATVRMATYADPFVATVDATELDADGVRTGRTWTLGLGAGGAPYAASGPLAVPQPVGPYPLVGLDVAKSRLGGGWAGVSGAVIEEGPQTVIDPAVTAPGESLVSGSLPPIDSPRAAEPVHIVGVEPDRVWIWDSAGDAWMVPGYRFVDAAQNEWSVPAIADDLLKAPGANATSDKTETSEPSEQAGTPSTAITSPTVPPTTVAGDGQDVPDESAGPELAPDAAAALNGLVGTATLAEFTDTAKAFGLTVRVSNVGGVSKVLTMDFNPKRVNVEVDRSYNANPDSARIIAIESIG